MATQSKTGRSGSVTVASVVIPITKWSLKGTKDLADSTDSGNYDPPSGQTYKSQQPGVIGLEGTIEGNWDAATTSSGIIAKLKADPPLPCVFKIDASTNYASGNFDLSDVETSVEVPGATMIKFTANVKSNGIFVLS
jgi:hypothetical protein